MDDMLVSISALTVPFILVLHSASGLYPPSFTEKPRWPDRSYYDEDGPPLTLNCKVTNVTYRMLWTKDGHVIDLVKEQLFLTDGNQSLVFEDPKRFQSGSYRCLASNSAGNVSHTGYILIAERKQETRPEVVDTQPINKVQHADIGDKVNISCTFDVGGSVEALMDLAVDWFKEDKLVNDTNHTTYGINNTFENNKISSLSVDSLKTSDYGTYKCYGENSKGNASRFISVVPPLHKSTKDIPLTLIIACSSGGFVALVTLVIVAIIVRRRNNLRLKYEELEWLDNNQYEVPERKIEYDVFISYSNEDLKWVKDVLFHGLCQNGYNVCIDFKDFTPGVAVPENIIDAIYKSHKTIVLMSKNFLKSMWGQFELQQAHNRAIMKRSDVLILIKFDNSKIPTKLLGKTFLDWSDSKIQPHFWSRLFEAIGEPAKFDNTNVIKSDQDFNSNENRDVGPKDDIDVKSETYTTDNTESYRTTFENVVKESENEEQHDAQNGVNNKGSVLENNMIVNDIIVTV